MGKAVSTTTLTSPQVEQLILDLDGVKIATRTLASWATRGVVVPSFWPRRRGRANPRRYAYRDVLRARLVAQLRYKAGVSMPEVRRVLAYLDAQEQDVWRWRSRDTLVVAGRTVYVRHADGPDVSVPDGQTKLPFDLAEIRDSTARALRA